MKEKQCKQCKSVMEYNYHYQCYQCNCGKVYNAFGQELAPVDNWADEYDNEDY